MCCRFIVCALLNCVTLPIWITRTVLVHRQHIIKILEDDRKQYYLRAFTQVIDDIS